LIINKNMTISEVMKANSNAKDILLNCGMCCVDCPSAQAETLEEACNAHEVDLQDIINKLNQD